ncbi:MAG: DsbA family protein [Nitrosopumilus sp.]|nr:DsbA family protein [Nitrosopumilus sp.]
MDNFESDHLNKQEQQVVVNKSTYNKLIISIISVAIVSAFLGGYVIGGETAEPKEVIIRETIQEFQPNPTAQEQFGPQIIRNISLDDDPMKGNTDAAITIVEFSDFQCPFCAKFHETTLGQIEKEYISTGKVNFVYRDFPVQSTHPNAIPAALASECADDQERFWDMHDMIFENQRSWQDLQITQSVDMFRQYAMKLGLDTDEFDSCLESGKHLEEIRNDLNDGRTYGVTGTPGFFVGNEKIGFVKIMGAQPFSSFQQVIDVQLNK